jgi:TolB protein
MSRTRIDHRFAWAALAAALCAIGAALLVPARGASQTAAPADQPLPPRIVIDVDSPELDLYRIAVPNLLGGGALSNVAADVLRNDLRLVSLFNVLDPRSFLANLEQEGLGIKKASWSSTGAQGVVKGQVTGSGGSISVDMRLYEVARGESAILNKSYRGSESELRGFMHDFGNEILRVLTGKPGGFGTRITFARKGGPGHKDIYVADFDGHGQGRVSSGRSLAMLPAFGPGGVWYSVLTNTGMFITNVQQRERPVIGGSGLNSGVAICDGRVLFSSTRDGNSEIYSANFDGSGVRRLTNHPAIDVSPACGPGGQVAFVSARHGGPQIFVMSVNGGEPRRVSYKGSHNQTPAFCPDPTQSLIGFAGRDAGSFDIFTIDLKTGTTKRLTQSQGSNTDPAFSPDCRMVAFASARGGLYISNPDGLNQTKILPGNVSTVRWRTRKD